MSNLPNSAADHERLRSVIIWTVTVAWAAMIFIFSTGIYGSYYTGWLLSRILEVLDLRLAPATFTLLHFAIRKLAHLSEYGLYSLLLYHSLRGNRQPFWWMRTAIWTIVIAGAYSLTDEFHQTFVPNRGPSLEDCGLDTTGAALGMVMLYAMSLFSSGTQGAASRKQESRPEVSSPRPGSPVPTDSSN